MNHELLKSVIFDQHAAIQAARITPRGYTFEKNANYVLVGLRRAGKSTLLFDIARKLVTQGTEWNQIIYINFEDERLAEFTAADFNDLVSVQSELSGKKGFFFLDEVQNIPGWEKFARRMADAKERVYITGSNARMMSREIASTLGGRYLTRTIAPYSFGEYLDSQEIPHSSADLLQTKTGGRIRGCCVAYLNYGGLPESLSYQAKRDYISSVYQKVLLGDIITRNGIRNDYAVKILIKKIAEAVCNDVSFSKLHNTLKTVGIKISKDTVIDYVGYAEDSYLLFHLSNFYAASFADREGTPKYYFADNGLLNLFLNHREAALLENAVATSLARVFPEGLFYLKSAKTGLDVDFFLPEVGTAIQVAYSIAGDARKREVENLKKLVRLEPQAQRLMIVTYEEEEHIREDGVEIEVVPLYRFLLQAENLRIDRQEL